MIIIIINIVLLGVLGLFLGINGGIFFLEGDEAIGIGAIFTSFLLLITVIICTILICTSSSESTEKIIGKGVITKTTNIKYYNGGEDSVDDFTYFVVTEDNTKIIVDKADWESIENEYTYARIDVDIIDEKENKNE